VRYHQLSSEERYTLAALRQRHYSQAEIARVFGRHPSTISRELRLNRREDGGYGFTACERTRVRRSRSRFRRLTRTVLCRARRPSSGSAGGRCEPWPVEWKHCSINAWLLNPLDYGLFAWNLWTHKVCWVASALGVLPGVGGLLILARTPVWAVLAVNAVSAAGARGLVAWKWSDNVGSPRLQKRLGFGAAANIAILHAHGEGG